MPTTSSPLHQHLEQLLPDALAFLEELVSINSFTLNAEGVDANAVRIIEQFAPFGFDVRQVPCELEGTGKHLILDSGGDGPAVALISHLDTVYSSEEEARNQFHWRPEGTKIYGPGTTDIKGGTVLLWMVLGALKATDPELFSQTRWIVILNAAEEMLLPDFGALCKRVLPDNTRACLVFEGDSEKTEGFCLVNSRKGNGNFVVDVVGHSAHAGGSYRSGANAIHQLCRVVDRMMALTDLSTETTVNVGVIGGGTVRNTVPGHACAEFEIRSFDEQRYREVRDAVLAMSGEGEIGAPDGAKRCEIHVTQTTENPVWPANPATEALIEVWKQAAHEAGHQLDAKPRGGLSDGNALWNVFPTLDGLGPRGGNAHCSLRDDAANKEPEYVDTTSFVPKALINCKALKRLLGG